MGTIDRHVQSEEVGEGRIRGFVIPQLEFNEPNFLKAIRNCKSVDSLTFKVLDEEPPPQKGQRISDKSINIFWLQQLIGHSYELVFDEVKKKYGNRKGGGWPPIMEFFYHLRNGCFHGNKFTIDKDSIKPNNKPVWREKEITVHCCQQVIGHFFERADCICFLHEVEQELNA